MATTITDDGFEIHKGVDSTRKYQYLEDDGVTPIDITGATFVCTFAKEDYSAIVFSGTVTITDAVNGKFEVTVDEATSNGYTPVIDTQNYRFLSSAGERLSWDCNITTGGTESQIVRGNALFKLSATP